MARILITVDYYNDNKIELYKQSIFDSQKENCVSCSFRLMSITSHICPKYSPRLTSNTCFNYLPSGLDKQ